MDLEKLRNWFLENKRDFPWRNNPTPYQVLVSEIMLQQTRAAVVIPYYIRWMHRFPTLADLANAAEDEVIKIWEGLGYYSRARALHQAAKWVIEHYQGEIPRGKEELEAIPGIGPYTSGAIRSFAFKEKAPAVDGNVMRVLARHLAVDLEVSTAAAKKQFHAHLENLLTIDQGWIEMEALIELGATHCSKNPECHLCPIRTNCVSYREGSQKKYPQKKKPAETIRLCKEVVCLLCENEILIKRNPKGQVMADLYEFPFYENLPKELMDEGLCREKFDKVKHSFTKYEVSLFPSVWEIPHKKEIEGYLWISRDDVKKYPFSAGHKRILEQLVKN